MNIHYRIIKIDNEAHSVAVRYYTDVLSEIDLTSLKDSNGDAVLDSNGYPIQCRTDVNLTFYNIDNPTEEDLVTLVQRAVPGPWLEQEEKLKLGLISKTMENIQDLATTTGSFVYVAPEANVANSVSTSTPISPRLTPASTWYIISEEGIASMFDYLNLTTSDVVYDMGTGDGKIAIEAKKRGALKSVGVDIDPDQILIAQNNAVSNNVTVDFVNDDICNVDVSDATIIIINLTNGMINRFAVERINNVGDGARIVSYMFPIPWLIPEKVLANFDTDLPVYIYRIRR